MGNLEPVLPCRQSGVSSTFVVEVKDVAGAEDLGDSSWVTLWPADKAIPTRGAEII